MSNWIGNIDLQLLTTESWGWTQLQQGLEIYAARRGNGPSYNCTLNGSALKSPTAITEAVLAEGMTCIQDQLARSAEDTYRLYIGQETVVSLTYSNRNGVYMRVASLNRELVERLRDTFDACVGPKKSQGYVYVLASTMGGLELKSVGRGSEALCRDNYSDEVLAAFDHVAADLRAKEPCGRISIFDGPPGTGKTFLLRALLDAVPDAMFVILPPHLVPEISGPDLITAIIDNQPCSSPGEDDKNMPIVFLLEDADAVLVPRGPDNMAGISTLLNLSDGILGKILDLRVVATTNAEVVSVEPAIMRPGRLCRRVGIYSLNPVQCAKIIVRLLETRPDMTMERVLANGYEANRKYTVAELYRFVRSDTQFEAATESPGIGFHG